MTVTIRLEVTQFIQHEEPWGSFLGLNIAAIIFHEVAYLGQEWPDTV